MAQILCSVEQAQALLNIRKDYKAGNLSNYDRKNMKRRIINQIKTDHGLPSSQRIVLFIENPQNPLYCVIRDKRTRRPLDNGAPEAVVSAVAAPAKKAAAKKAPAAKKAAPAKKAPAAKKAAAPAKKAAAPKVKTTKKGQSSPVKTDACTMVVRTSINGKMTQLGWASTQEMKDHMIKQAKAQALKG